MQIRSDIALVVPSIRLDSALRFVREWKETGLFDRVDFILMEDNKVRTFDLGLPQDRYLHLSWEDIDKHAWSWIIPRRSDTVRSFGYWKAYQMGYEYLMTLDDDCYPAQGYENLADQHLAMLTRSRWFSTLNSVRPRGVPYENIGTRQVHVNHGIWKGVLDYDAPQQLVQPTPEVYTYDNRIVPHGAYHPFCGMNVMWRREAMVLSYHLLMGKMLSKSKSVSAGPKYVAPSTAFPVDPLDKLPFDRFGDIWCGIIQKKICDHLGWVVATGTPYIHHDRASNPFTNLRKEANGIEVNEWFWQKIDAVDLSMSHTAKECYKDIALSVKDFGGEHGDYWNTLGNAMLEWSDLFL